MSILSHNVKSTSTFFTKHGIKHKILFVKFDFCRVHRHILYCNICALAHYAGQKRHGTKLHRAFPFQPTYIKKSSQVKKAQTGIPVSAVADMNIILQFARFVNTFLQKIFGLRSLCNVLKHIRYTIIYIIIGRCAMCCIYRFLQVSFSAISINLQV